MNFILNIFKGVWADVKARWDEDISGKTLLEFQSGPHLYEKYPRLFYLLCYVVAIWRILEYWIGTGIIGIIGPWLGVILIIYYFKQLLAYGVVGIAGIILYLAFFVFIEWKWVIPYFLSKGYNVKE